MAAQMELSILCLDVAQAFLKGCTFQQLTELYGQKPRNVQFRMPQEGLSELKQIAGFKDMYASTVALDLLRPGFGLNNAPKAWLLRLNSALKSAPLGLQLVAADPQLFVRHSDDSPKKLLAVVSTHVDDLKAAVTPDFGQLLIKTLTSAFGQLKIQWKRFEHCGIVHEH
eukprot:5403849-Amphidinium_carterae.1